MILKSILISSLFFTYSLRTPIIEDCAIDYELASGYKFSINQTKIIPSINLNTRFLLEREVGLYGHGHDILVEYIKEDSIFNKIGLTGISSSRKFNSYYRQVKDFSIQDVDTGYGKKNVKIGYSVNYIKFADPELMFYSSLDFYFLKFDARFRYDRTSIDLWIGKEFYIDNNKKYYIMPFLDMKIFNDEYDLWSKIEVGYKI